MNIWRFITPLSLGFRSVNVWVISLLLVLSVCLHVSLSLSLLKQVLYSSTLNPSLRRNLAAMTCFRCYVRNARSWAPLPMCVVLRARALVHKEAVPTKVCGAAGSAMPIFSRDGWLIRLTCCPHWRSDFYTLFWKETLCSSLGGGGHADEAKKNGIYRNEMASCLTHWKTNYTALVVIFNL